MYYDEFKYLIESILYNNISKEELMKYIYDKIDCELIYNSDDELLTDAYFSIKHYASGEEQIQNKEWKYLLQCFNGIVKYNLSTKMNIK